MSTLNRVLDENLAAVMPRGDGLTLSVNLANKLGVKLGDRVRVQATDGHRGQRRAASGGHRETLSRRRRVHAARIP